MNEFEKMDESLLRDGIKWFSKKLKGVVSNKPEDKHPKDIENLKDAKTKLQFMNLYTTIYSKPKYAKSLPYFDAFPLFFPISVNYGSEGPKIMSFNLHYLPPALRMKFLKELEIIVTRDAKSKGFSPDDLKYYPRGNVAKVIGRYMNQVYLRGGGSSGAMIRQAYRSYFFSRMSGKLKYIPVTEWEKAGRVILPVFRKQSSSEIYKDIREQYKKYKSNPRKPIW